MKTINIQAFVFMEKAYQIDANGNTDYCSPQVWTPVVWKCQVSDDLERVFIGEQTVAVQIPDDFDPRPAQIKALEEQKDKARADFAALVVKIDREINQLLAIEN